MRRFSVVLVLLAIWGGSSGCRLAALVAESGDNGGSTSGDSTEGDSTSDDDERDDDESDDSDGTDGWDDEDD